MSVCKEKGIDISCDITGSVKCLDEDVYKRQI